MNHHNPRVEKEGKVWKFLGDWTRDLPIQVRYEANETLRLHPLPESLDLTAIGFLDSWGEERIADLCWEMGQGSITGLPEFGLRHSLYSYRLAISDHPMPEGSTPTWTFTKRDVDPS